MSGQYCAWTQGVQINNPSQQQTNSPMFEDKNPSINSISANSQQPIEPIPKKIRPRRWDVKEYHKPESPSEPQSSIQSENERIIKELSSENKQLKQNIAEREQSEGKLKDERNQLHHEIDHLKSRCNSYDDRVAELKQDLKSSKELIERQQAEKDGEIEWLKTENKRLFIELLKAQDALKNANDATKEATDDGKKYLDLAEQRTKEVASIREQLQHQVDNHEEQIKDYSAKLEKERVDKEKLEIELNQKKVELSNEHYTRKKLQEKFGQNEAKARAFLSAQQQKRTQSLTSPDIRPKSDRKRRCSETADVAESSKTMEQVLNAEVLNLQSFSGNTKQGQKKNTSVKIEEQLKLYQGLEERHKELDKCDELQTKLDLMNNKYKRLQKQLDTMKGVAESSQSQLVKVECRLKQYTDYLGELSPSDVSDRYQKLRKNNEELQMKFSKLQDKIKSKQQKINELSNLRENNCQLSRKVTELTEELDVTINQLQIKTKELEEATHNCQNLKTDLVERNNQLHTMKKLKNDEISELSLQRIKTKSLEESNSQLQDELTRVRQQFSEKDEQLARQRHLLAQAHEQLDTIKTAIMKHD